ncbi:glycosyl hydrolase family 61-domain-containing protein [Filobasidium floriforme]|uniref:glycosyl hydrolase family 61-domain-containing protein n=1 Tax=Filobasidium floriforme TaxID=5210 RepID=UPI001E8DDBFF|nr:glycosyl hydrolase family 61-domain-containing protein [Filobasidium floriforme]KAH8090821.1 glycosyl hydrolase family 61-domain-containing protein [Filobasidium floriforme]
MLFRTALLVVALKALPAWSHSLLYNINIGGIDYGGWSDETINTQPTVGTPRALNSIQRPIPNDSPIRWNAPNIATGETQSSAPKTAPANAGDEVVVTWWRWYDMPDNHQGLSIFKIYLQWQPDRISHPVYMAKCADDCNGEAGADMEWFKTHEWGFDGAAGQWPTLAFARTGTTDPTATTETIKPSMSFKLPTSLPGGSYLVRVNIIALHSSAGPEYYPRAFQIKLASAGTDLPSPTGKFPAIYADTSSPRNKDVSSFEIWNNACDPPSLMYQIPGLDVIAGGVSVNANNVALCPAAEAGVKASGDTPAGGNAPAGGQNATDASSASVSPSGTSASARPVDPTVPAFEGNAKNNDPSATLDPGAKLPQTLANSDGTTAASFNTAAATSRTAADAPALPTGQGAPAASAIGGLDEQAWETCGKIRVNFESCTHMRF